MKRLNFNIKDRKVLTLGLCLVLVCVFTLTVAYSALNAVLTINGNARVSAADWDIYLNNPRVTSGSATTNLPVIKTSSTLEFETTLNMPGDFYEFVVDVVNSGSIDAMIENVIKNPELDASQKKYLNYEVTYQNGESITTKQTLSKGTTMPIKVRIEYRKDLVASDLPTGQVVLDLSLTLEYIQSDGTGTSVPNNGVLKPVANGDINEIGTIVTIGDQQFYTIGTEGDNVKLFSMYGLQVGNTGYWGGESTPIINPTGMQDPNTGFHDVEDGFTYYGVTAFSSDTQKGTNYSDYSGSIVEGYVNNYKNILESNFGVNIVEARLITVDELDIFDCGYAGEGCNNGFAVSSLVSFWTGTPNDSYSLYVFDSMTVANDNYDIDFIYTVRPVIVISNDYFN